MSSPSELGAPFILNNGRTLPKVGLGTFQGDHGNSQVKEIVSAAIKSGYRHIDCATAYGNEKEVGSAIQDSGIARDELFITTKLAQTWHKPSDVAEALEQSLKNLQLDYVPHAYVGDKNHVTVRHPSGNGKPLIDHELSRAYPDVWKAMEKLVESGRAISIGLSNFNILKTKRILEIAKIRPAVNQVELHPYLPQHELLSFCTKENIHLMAHQPLGGKPLSVVNPNISRPGPLSDPHILQIASECGKSPAQILLSWAVQRGTSVIPKTTHRGRLVENLEICHLSDGHFQAINRLHEEVGTVRFLDPSSHIGFDIFDEVNDEPVNDSPTMYFIDDAIRRFIVPREHF